MPRDLSGMNVKASEGCSNSPSEKLRNTDGFEEEQFSQLIVRERRVKDYVDCEDYIIGYAEYLIDYRELYEDIIDEFET